MGVTPRDKDYKHWGPEGGMGGTTQTSDKPQGFMRGLAGFGDWMTGGLTDFDKRGDSGLQTFQKGLLFGGSSDNQIFPERSTSHLVGGKISRQERDNFIMSVTPRSGTMLSDVQRDRQVLDSTTSAASQETYAFGQDSNSAVQEVASTAMVGGTLPRNGRWSTYKTVL